MQTEYLVGVDEAGRGPLAGPVAIGIAVVSKNFDWNLIPGVNDSKKLSEKKREEIAARAKILKKEGRLNYKVILVSASVIDSIGITHAVKRGIDSGFSRLKFDPKKVSVKLDGLLRAPSEYLDQETIIKGDAKEKIIGLASIMAKVTRDAHMVQLSSKYSQYGFEVHKGYGTLRHREMIKKYGLSDVHRMSFCKSLS